MLRKIQQRLRDMRIIKHLCQDAEHAANTKGQQAPGPEHFILAALALPDGSARRAFVRVGADPDRFAEAITQQYRDALASIGVAPDAFAAIDAAATPVPPVQGVFQAKPAAGTLMRQLAEWPKASADEVLSGAHVVAVAAGLEQGVVGRALRAMGIDTHALIGAARSEIHAMRRD